MLFRQFVSVRSNDREFNNNNDDDDNSLVPVSISSKHLEWDKYVVVHFYDLFVEFEWLERHFSVYLSVILLLNFSETINCFRNYKVFRNQSTNLRMRRHQISNS